MAQQLECQCTGKGGCFHQPDLHLIAKLVGLAGFVTYQGVRPFVIAIIIEADCGGQYEAVGTCIIMSRQVTVWVRCFVGYADGH